MTSLLTLAGAAQRPSDERRREMIPMRSAFAALVGCVFVADRPQRQRCAAISSNAALADGDADHSPPTFWRSSKPLLAGFR